MTDEEERIKKGKKEFFLKCFGEGILGHQEIIHYGETCPLCEKLKELDKLRKEFYEMDKSIKQLLQPYIDKIDYRE